MYFSLLEKLLMNAQPGCEYLQLDVAFGLGAPQDIVSIQFAKELIECGFEEELSLDVNSNLHKSMDDLLLQSMPLLSDTKTQSVELMDSMLMSSRMNLDIVLDQFMQAWKSQQLRYKLLYYSVHCI